MKRLTYPGYTTCPQEQLFRSEKNTSGKMGFRKLEALFFCIGFLLLAGCAGVRPGGPPVASELTGLSWMLQRPSGTVQNLSLEQIRDTLGSGDTKFSTLKAKAKMAVVAPAMDDPLSCDGYIRLQRPNRLRIIGTKLISTVFNILSDGETYWIYLPSEKRVYTGRCNSVDRLARLGVNIFPDDIAMLLNYGDALATGAILTKDVNITTVMETWPGLWLIHLVDLSNETPKLLANLYVDRVGVNVIRYDLFGDGGNIRVQALFDDYARFDDFPVPQKIAIFWPDEDTRLTLALTNIVTNEQIDPKVFQFSKPKRAEMVFVDDIMW